METVDFKALSEHFQTLKIHKFDDSEVHRTHAEGPVDDGANEALTESGKKCRCSDKKAKTARIGPLVPTDMTATEFVVAIVDRVLQFRMHGLGKNNDPTAFAKGMRRFVDDAGRVLEHLKTVAPECDKGSPSFWQVLHAVVCVCTCSADPKPGEVLPSLVRSARQTVNTASALPAPFKIAAAMVHYNGPKKAMEASRQISAAGIEDRAADEVFAGTFDRLEKNMGTLFDDDIAAFAVGDIASPHTMTSFGGYMQFCLESAVELNLAIGQWSTGRLEEQADDIGTVLRSWALVNQAGIFVAATAFHRELQGFRRLVGDERLKDGEQLGAASAEPEQDGADVNTLVKTEPEHASEASLAPGVAPAGDVTTPSGTDDSAMKALRDEVPAFTSALAQFMTTLRQIVSQGSDTTKALVRRLGQTFETKLGEMDLDFDTLVTDTATNSDEFDTLCSYLHDMAVLTDEPPLTLELLQHDLSAKQAYLQKLSSFCCAHRRFAANGDQVVIVLSLAGGALLNLIKLDAHSKQVMTTFGKQVYDAHATPAITALVASFQDFEVRVVMCEPSVIEKHSAMASLLNLILGDPSSEVLDRIVKEQLVSDKATDLLDEMPHRVLLKNLRLVFDAVDEPSVSLPGPRRATHEGDGPATLTAERALTYLGLVVGVRDIAVLLSCLHHRMVMPINSNTTLTKEAQLKLLPVIFGALDKAISELSNFLSAREVTEMEREGWVLPLPFSLARNFEKNSKVLHGRYLTMLVTSWAGLLGEATEKTMASCPPWGCCMTDSSFDEEMAVSMTQGKLAGLVRTHNAMHDLLSSINTAAVQVRLTPRVQEHEASRSSVKAALHSLGIVSAAVTICSGTQLVAQVKNRRDGASQVRSFLDRHPADMRSETPVPNGFWVHLQACALETTEARPVVKPDSIAPTTPSNSSAVPSDQGARQEVKRPCDLASQGGASGSFKLKRRRQ